MTTHCRIEEYVKRNPIVGNHLLAVKHVGNAGSHEDRLTAVDVIETAEILAHALRLLYDNTFTIIERRTAQINKRKGLPRKRELK